MPKAFKLMNYTFLCEASPDSKQEVRRRCLSEYDLHSNSVLALSVKEWIRGGYKCDTAK